MLAYAFFGMFMHIGGGIMRTTLDLPEDLLNKPMKKVGLNTKTAVIILALKELLRKETISRGTCNIV